MTNDSAPDNLTVEECVATLKLLLGEEGYKKWCQEQWRMVDRAIDSYKQPDDYTPCMTHADEALDGVVARTKTPAK